MEKMISLKGSKEGYHLYINSDVTFQILMEEVHDMLTSLSKENKSLDEQEKVKEKKEISQEDKRESSDMTAADSSKENETEESNQNVKEEITLRLTIHTGRSLWVEEEKEKMTALIEEQSDFIVEEYVSDVILTDEMEDIFEERRLHVYTDNLRGGQVVEAPVDLLFVGNVQPGAELRAGRHIFIIGNFQGLAHAGVNDDDQAIIVANFNHEAQLRIGDKIQINEQASTPHSNYSFAFINDLNVFEFQDIKEIKNIRSDIDII